MTWTLYQRNRRTLRPTDAYIAARWAVIGTYGGSFEAASAEVWRAVVRVMRTRRAA